MRSSMVRKREAAIRLARVLSFSADMVHRILEEAAFGGKKLVHLNHSALTIECISGIPNTVTEMA